MPVIKLKANKMSEAMVSHISLVHRGANRIPFKIVKKEKQMGIFNSLDLSNLGKMFASKSEAPQGKVVGVITMKGDGFESIKNQVEAIGFTVSDSEEMDDGSVIFKQEDFDESGAVIRLSDNVAIVTKGFSPYSMDVTQDGVSFSDMCAANGFHPGINSIVDTLGMSLRAIVNGSSSVADAKQASAKLFQEAGTYVTSFLSGLPEKAFKLEDIVPDLPQVAPAGMSDAEAITKGMKPAPKKVCKTCGADPDAEPERKTEQESTEGTETSTESGKEGEPVEKTEAPLTKEAISAIVSAQVAQSQAEFADTLSVITTGFAGVQKSFTEFGARLNAFTTRIDAVESVAKAANEAVRGTVIGQSDMDVGSNRGPIGKKTHKADFDTAMLPKPAFRR